METPTGQDKDVLVAENETEGDENIASKDKETLAQGRLEKLTFVEEGLTPVWDLDFVREIQELLNEKFAPFLRDEEFFVQAGVKEDRLYLKMELAKKDRSWAYPIECVAFLKDKKAFDFALLILDYLDCYWEEYLTAGRESYVTLEWSLHTCEEHEFFVRGFERNLQLERLAEELFQKHGHGEHVIYPITSET